MKISKTGGGLSLREDYAETSFREHIGALSRSHGGHTSALLCEVRDGAFRIVLPHCFPASAGKKLVGRLAGVFNRCPEKILKGFFWVPTITHSRRDLQFEYRSPRHRKHDVVPCDISSCKSSRTKDKGQEK
ncbi:MAG: hypothetical protein D4R83_04040 [Streptomycetaceae bacterium]|nr:MAG: hypothetical protein D4R83_04040 [Streptomycetaceae bacterium]